MKVNESATVSCFCFFRLAESASASPAKRLDLILWMSGCAMLFFPFFLFLIEETTKRVISA